MSADFIIDWALSTGLSISLLIAIILLVRRPFARRFGAGAAYTLWLLPLARLFMPGMTLAILPSSQVGPIPPNAAPIEPAFVVYEPIYTGSHAAVPSSNLPSLAVFAVTVWLIGTAIWLSMQLVRHARHTQMLRRQSMPASENILSIACCIADEIGLTKMPEVRTADDNRGPLMTGFIKPLIILPNGFETQFTDLQQDIALTHEMAHIKRADVWAALAYLAFRALNWPNPLVHFAARAFRADQEAACDAWILARSIDQTRTRKDYARTLLEAARITQSGPDKLAWEQAMPLGLTIHHPLKERLMTLKNSPRRTGPMSKLLAGSALIGLAALTAPITLAQSTPETPPTPEMAGKHSSMKSKKVMKWTEEKDGVEVSKHYEIIEEDGVKTAYEIDADGNKTQVDPATIKHTGPDWDHFGPGHDFEPGKRKVVVMDGQSGKVLTENVFVGDDIDMAEIEKHIEIMKEKHGEDGPHKIKIIRKGGDGADMSGDVEKRVRIMKKSGGQHGEGDIVTKRVKVMSGDQDGGQNVQVYAFSTEEDVEVFVDSDGQHGHMSGGAHTKARVMAAEGLLENVDDEELSRDAKRKLEKARKALAAAREALEEE